MILRRSEAFRSKLLMLSMSALLAACGGGGGGDDDVVRVIPDTTPPTVTATDPVTGGAGIVTDTLIRATFSESISAASVNEDSLTLSDGAANIAGTVSLASNVITLTPAQPLDETVTYTATVAVTVTDLAGNRLAAPYAWSFTTGDFTPPTVSATSPSDGDDDVAIDQIVVANLSEALDPATVGAASLMLTSPGGAVSGTVSLGLADNVVTFTPDDILNTLTDYEAKLDDSVADPAGNSLDMPTSWNFRTSLAGTLSAVYASEEAPAVVRRVDAYEDRVVGRNLLSNATWEGLVTNSILINADGSLVAFRAEELVAGMVDDELYVTSVEGGPPLKVSGTLVNGGSVWVADWSPDGTQLAYVADKTTDGVNELYLVNADGTGETRLTTGLNLDETFVSWSPDGAYLAVATHSSSVQPQALRIVPVAGGAPVSISGPATVQLSEGIAPSWSPDGTLIAYATLQELFVNDRTGLNPVETTPATSVAVTRYQWLSDSDRLVWLGRSAPGTDPTRIFISSASTGFGQELTAAECFTFSVAPDDSLVAFTRTDGATVALYVVAPDGTGESAVSLTPASAQRVRETSVPVWAPDGSSILYAERITSLLKYELHITAPDGSGNVTLSDIEGSANELEAYSFSPDGRQIVYGAFSTRGMLYRVNPDGTGRTLLTDNLGGEDARAASLRDDVGSVDGLRLAP